MHRFFGDSITVGSGAKYASRSYVSLILNELGSPTFQNKAVGGNMAFDNTTAVHNSVIAVNDVSFYMTGTNDERSYQESLAGLAAFTNCIKSQYAWMGIVNKIMPRTANATYTGNWVDSLATGIGRRTDGTTTGQKVSFNLTGETVYIGSIQSNSFNGTANVLVDGVQKATINTYVNVPNTLNGATYGSQVIKINGLSNTSHLIEIVCTSGYVYFEWAGVAEYSSKVYAISPFRKTPSAYQSTGCSEFGLRQMRDATKSVAEELANDGINIEWIDTYYLINPPADLTTDGIHPSDYGHRALAEHIIINL